MEFVSSLKNFLSNHRNKFLISGIVVGSTVAVFNFIRYQEEKRQKLEVNEFLESALRQRHFETIQPTCDQTIVTLSKRLEKYVIQILNIDSIVSDLKKNKASDNLPLWENLKIAVFTQICLMVYAQVFLVFVLKIQFAIIGGYMHKNLDENYTGEKISRSAQEQYLTLCVSFIGQHLVHLCDYIKSKVTDIVSDLDFKKKLTIQNLQDLFWSIQTSINNEEFIANMPKYLQIDSRIKNTTDLTLRQIYEETVDVLCAKELSLNCVDSLLNCEFAFVIEQLVSALTEDMASTKKNEEVESLPAVKILPVLHKMIKLKQGENDESTWVKNIMLSEKLKILAANIYESFC